MKRIFYLLIISLLCSACKAPVNVKNITEGDVEWLLSGAALPGQQTEEFSIPNDRALYLTSEMQDFADRAVSGYAGLDKVTALLGSLLYASGLDLKYDVRASFTAEETFFYGRANCLSFTNLFIAMARHVGMDAQYNEVDVPPIWDLRERNTLVLNKHVNAVVTTPDKIRHVIDLNVEEYEPTYEQRNISDSLAVAQHFNNKGMGYLLAGEYLHALRYLVKAISMEPHTSYLWNNLGSLYRRAGNIKAAEKAYLVALSEDASDPRANSNVARLYEEIGNQELAAYYEKKAHHYRMRNPYFLYGLAQEAFAEKDYARAKEHISDAIHRYDKEHRFYFLRGAIYQQIGDHHLADVNFNKALELSEDGEQQARYRSKMDRLSDISS
ncbi:MAG: Flp pilus assembly protein TadD [Planctomycetota bacterium]|jgi:Flp pilus assembly protein TadD